MTPAFRVDGDDPTVTFRSATLVLVLVTATVLAGCAAPDGSTTPTATPTTTEAGPLADDGIDAEATWERTVAMLDANATRPAVFVQDESTSEIRLPSVVRVYAGPPTDGLAGGPAAYYRHSDNAVVFAQQTVANASTRQLESILVHEYAHAIQAQDERFALDETAIHPRDRLVLTTLREGMARYVEVSYERSYTNVSDGDRFEVASQSTAQRWMLAPYVYGFEYYDRRVDEPANLPDVVAESPTSTEEVLHPDATDGAPLSVTATDLGPWFVERDGTTWGEAGTRVVLWDELPEGRAVAAAGGWANDSHYVFDTEGSARGHAWVHRWDEPDEATEFASAMETFLDRRRAETDRYRFHVQRVAPETTVVLAGRGGFVDNATVSADGNASVAVSVSG